MTRIAHLSDLHLLEAEHARRAAGDQLRLSILTLGRPLDEGRNRRRVVSALRQAHTSRADHLVLSGDLTEDGAPAQFEVLADVLAESRWSPDDVTIVPGNHDGYHSADGWLRALDGPMAAYRRTSAPGAITELRDATIFAVATTIDQHWLRAAGRVGPEQRRALGPLLQREEQRGRAVAVAMHHPPMAWGLRLGFLEGLRDIDQVSPILRARRNSHVLCGHIHRGGDHRFGDEADARIFVADAVVDHHSPLRLYEARGGQLWAIDEQVRTPIAAPALA